MQASNTAARSALDPQEQQRRFDRRHMVARVLLAACYLAAGWFHLTAPHPFVAIVPAWVPQPALVVQLTGFCELAGAVALFVPLTRRFAAVMLSLYAICVYPANIEHAVIELSGTNPGHRWLYHAPRLFAQPFIVWWTLYAGDIVGGLRFIRGRRIKG